MLATKCFRNQGVRKMSALTTEEILEKLHNTESIPRLEIEGGKYPINEKLLELYRKVKVKRPKKVGDFSLVEFGGNDSDGQWWLEHDGFGGMTGSVNIESIYLEYANLKRGNRCVYVLKNLFDRQSDYYTVIDRKYLIFSKSDLITVIKAALGAKSKMAEKIILATRIIDNVIWDDSIPTGLCCDGPKVTPVKIILQIDLRQEEPGYKITLQLPS